jgi:hypothetical protein
VAAATLLLAVSAAYAAAQSFTETEKGVTESFTDVLPCVSDSADITITYNAVFHFTGLDNGTTHVTGTLAGQFTAVANGVTYTGRFAQWFGENVNGSSYAATSTFHIAGKGSDGSRVNFQETAHVSVSASGIEVSFDKATCA